MKISSLFLKPATGVAERNRQGSRWPLVIMLGVALLVTLLVYKPGLEGPFLLDDLVNLQQLGDNGGIDSFQTAAEFVLGNQSGPAGRPVSMASFLLDARNWPADSAAFKVTNLIIHLLSGLLTAWFSLLMLRRLQVDESRARILSAAIAALWLLHPLNVSTTLYVVQRMTQLMMLFALAGLICYLKGRELMESRPRKGLLLMSLCLFPFGVLSVLSKENGALLLVAILALEATLYAGRQRTVLHRFWLAIGVVLPLAAVVGYAILNFSDLTAAYQYREFSLVERLLTQPRVVFDYLLNIFVPSVQNFTLQHDDFNISHGLLDPPSTLVCLLLVAGALIAAVRWRTRQPVFSLAVFWFFGWHLLESTFLPLELYFEHRNYLPLIGPLFAVVYYFNVLLERVGSLSARRLLQVAGFASFLIFAVLTLQLTLLWGNNLALASHWADRHPASWRAQVEYAYLLAEVGETEAGYERVAMLQQRFPREVALQLLRWNFACSYGLPQSYSLAELDVSGDSVYYRADLSGEVKTLLENLFDDKCTYPEVQGIEAVLNRLSDVPMRKRENSGFHVLFSDLYVHYRRLNPALVQLRTAFDIKPDARFPIRQAVLSASAGNYQDSLLFLQRAREADENRAPFTPSRMDEIETMEEDLRARIGSE